MTSIQDTPTVTVNPSSRVIKAQFVLGPTVDDFGRDVEQVVQIYVSHNKDRRYFFGRLSTFTRGHDNGFVIESHDLFGGPQVQAPTVRVDRYSAKALQSYFDATLAYFRSDEVADQVAEVFAVELVSA